MAIIVEEEKNRSSIVRLLGWIGIIGIICAAIYYIFFAAPELIVIPASGTLSTIAPITNVSVKPEDVLNSQAFTALRQAAPTANPQAPGSIGRTNPFVAP